MEENLNQQQSTDKTFNLIDVLLALKKHLVLMLIIVCIFCVGGVVYSFFLKPEYTVTQKLVYRCENKNYMSGDKEIITNTTTSNINTMVVYGDTIIDLFDEGVVLDRANFYYNEYKKITDPDEAKKYLSDLEIKAKGDEKDGSYTPPTSVDNQLKFIEKSKISMDRISTEDETTFTFNVSYTDFTTEDATEKLSVLVSAFALECKETKTLTSGEETIKYFGEFEVIVSDLGVEGVSASVSRMRTALLFAVCGVVVALVTTLVISLLDNTIKSKKVLESLIDAPVLSSVEKWEN